MIIHSKAPFTTSCLKENEFEVMVFYGRPFDTAIAKTVCHSCVCNQICNKVHPSLGNIHNDFVDIVV